MNWPEAFQTKSDWKLKPFGEVFLAIYACWFFGVHFSQFLTVLDLNSQGHQLRKRTQLPWTTPHQKHGIYHSAWLNLANVGVASQSNIIFSILCLRVLVLGTPFSVISPIPCYLSLFILKCGSNGRLTNMTPKLVMMDQYSRKTWGSIPSPKLTLTNITPENWWLDAEFPVWDVLLTGVFLVSFREWILSCQDLRWQGSEYI